MTPLNNIKISNYYTVNSDSRNILEIQLIANTQFYYKILRNLFIHYPGRIKRRN